MLTGRDIVCISSIDWDFIWQGHQEIMSTLAAHGNRVLFIENTGVRRPTLRDMPRLRDRLRNWRRGFKGVREERPNLYVYSPLVLPAPYSRVARWINRILLNSVVKRWMRAAGFARPIAWSFLPTPLARDLIRDLDPELTVYYCIDDFAASSAAASRITASENAFFREADLVFVTSEKLRARAVQFNSRVYSFPFAVNFAAFERVRVNGDDVPDDIRALPRPVIGYVGGIHRWVDQRLIAAAAEQLPHATFALIGPVQTDVSALEGMPNVRLLGKRAHDEVPKYIKGFDVALIPYEFSDYTANVYPTKLNEYLAMGVPVVASDLPEIRIFRGHHGEDVVGMASDPDMFVGAIRQALDNCSPEAMHRRIEVARGNSWARRIDDMSALIEQALTVRRAKGESWQHRFRRAYRVSRERAAMATAIVGLTLALLFYTPLVWAVAEPLRVSATPMPADAVIVFAGGVGESGQAGGGYQERVRQALDLYKAGLVPTMLFSSGFRFAFREAEVMRDLAIDNGVDPSAVLIEARATNTYENVVNTRDIARAHAWRRVLLVSSPYHMRRAMLTWKKAAPDIEAVPTPVPVSQFYQHGIGANIDQIGGIFHEFAAIAAYWWRGWI